MSYCRWSSDNFKSDVYVYHSMEGYTIHVANYRTSGDVPPLAVIPSPCPKPDDHWWDEIYWPAYRAQHDFLDGAGQIAIGLVHDGASFCEDGPLECAARLRILREVGYHVPDGVIEELEGEDGE